MPAHPIPAYTPVHIPMDNGLLDDDFDMFEITPPRHRKTGIKQDILSCDGNGWDEFND